MAFVGLLVGLVIGMLFNSFAAALLLGVFGGCLGWFAAQKHATPPTPPLARPDGVAHEPGESPPATPSHPLISDLQHRLATLECRVRELEQAHAGTSLAQVAPHMPDPAANAAMASRRLIDVEPGAAIDAPLPVTLQDTPALAVPATATAPAPAPAPATATATATESPPPITREQPESPPAVPLRERLPAPLAGFVFGGNTLVKLGVLILFLGLAFLLRYTAERVTVSIELRYAGVALVGGALLALGWWLRHRRGGYGLILQGAGVGVFYLTTLAAMKLHMLIAPTTGFGFGFGLLLAAALLGAVLAVAQNAPVLAIIAALEGFAAPLLASTGSNRPLGLFTYLLVLDVGIFLIAWFKAWRWLNLIGLVGTFALAAAWAERHYTDAQYAIVQPYLVAFFVLFAAIGVLFARRALFSAPADGALPLAERAGDTLRRVGRVDSALVFGAPLAAFGMQYLLMRPWPHGAAYSALGFAAFYLALGRLIFATQPLGLALLAEAYTIVGVIFATLSIPLGLEGEWTSATWAVEAAGMYWLGARQSRPYARAFAFAVLAGAVVQLLRSVSVTGTVTEAATYATTDAITLPLLHGSVIGPLLMAASAFAMWRLWRRDQPTEAGGWEALAGVALPWLGMAALVLLPWQTFMPMWAAAATALLALAAFAVSVRCDLAPLRAVVLAMQALALVSFIATLHRGAVGEAALRSGWQGMAAAALIGLSMAATTAWALRQSHRDAPAGSAQPAWPLAPSVALLAAVSLLHLAMLFGIDLPHAALVWPFTAALVLWIGLRVGHAPLAALAGTLHLAAAVLFIGSQSDISAALGAFAHLGFWTPLALGLTAAVAGDWLRGEAAHATTHHADATAVQSSRNPWCAYPTMGWLPVIWALLWWLDAVLGESTRVLRANALAAYQPAAGIAAVLLTSAAAYTVAAWRDWRRLALTTLATLPGLAAAAVYGVVLARQASPLTDYWPSSAFGWLAWPMALLWHLLWVRGQRRWLALPVLAACHVAGVWLFVLVAARECQLQLSTFGTAYASWPLLGWGLVPAVVLVLMLWALRTPVTSQRWPFNEYRRAYLEWALAPLVCYLFMWCWFSNAVGAGDAAPLPFVPILNPLELVHWLVLAALLRWCKAVEGSPTLSLDIPAVNGLAAVTAWALVTGGVLRACHHYAGIAWQADALYASWLAQAALSITWALCGVAAMVSGHAKGSRAVWLGGAVLMGVVVLKLFFVELANQGGMFRIVSFTGVGALLLLVGYFAPVPPARLALRAASAA